MTDQSHTMELRYTIDDDGIWVVCTCRWEKCLGFWPSPSDITQAAADHLREMYP